MLSCTRYTEQDLHKYHSGTGNRDWRFLVRHHIHDEGCSRCLALLKNWSQKKNSGLRFVNKIPSEKNINQAKAFYAGFKMRRGKSRAMS